MSVQSSISSIQSFGNNSTVTPYPAPFYFFDSGDLVVSVVSQAGVETILTESVDYTVSGAGVETGGQIVTTAAIPITSKVTIYRVVDATQETEYEENDRFPASSHERALDKLTMLVQQAERNIEQGVRFRVSDGNMPVLAAVPSSVFGLDAAKVPRMMTSAEVAVWLNLTQQFFGFGTKTWLNDADRGAAVPDFLGQVGVQLDDFTQWTADGVNAGDWTNPAAGIVDGAVTTAKLANAVLSADVAGRSKMADAFLTAIKIATGAFTADSAGRLPFAAGFVNDTLLAAGAAMANMPAGTVVQTVTNTFNTLKSITTVIPMDDTIPQVTEGDEVLTASITPVSASNKILIEAILYGAPSASINTGAASIFRAGNSSALAAGTLTVYSGAPTCTVLRFLDSPASTSAVNYSMRAGPNSGTLYVNGWITGIRLFGGALRSSITLQEIKG